MCARSAPCSLEIVAEINNIFIVILRIYVSKFTIIPSRKRKITVHMDEVNT